VSERCVQLRFEVNGQIDFCPVMQSELHRRVGKTCFAAHHRAGNILPKLRLPIRVPAFKYAAPFCFRWPARGMVLDGISHFGFYQYARQALPSELQRAQRARAQANHAHAIPIYRKRSAQERQQVPREVIIPTCSLVTPNANI